MDFQEILDAAPEMCCTPPLNASDFISNELGTDSTNSTHAEVRIDQCKQCGAYWIHYQLENPAFSKSGKWYRGSITAENSKTITSENAAAYIELLNWYFYGGSYFSSTGTVGFGPLKL